MGWMPELGQCVTCGAELRDAWWAPTWDGLTCADDRREGGIRLTPATIAEIRRIFRSRLPELAEEFWTPYRAAAPLEFALGLLERNLNRRIRSGAALRNVV